MVAARGILYYTNNSRIKNEKDNKQLSKSTMKVTNVDYLSDVSSTFTGLVVDRNGHRVSFKDGKIHSENGPAVIYCNGSKEWWLDDFCYATEADWENRLVVYKMKRIVK
jgi:hypothetical protein